MTRPSGGDVPSLNDPRIGHLEQRPPLGRELDRVDAVPIRTDYRPFPTGRHVPEYKPVAVAARGQGRPVGRERQGPHGPPIGAVTSSIPRLAAVNVPELHQALGGCRGEGPPVGREPDAADRAAVAGQDRRRPLRLDVPEPDALVRAPRRQVGPVGREGEAEDPLRMTDERRPLRLRGNAPELDRAVEEARGEDHAIGREAETDDHTRGRFDQLGFDAPPHFPEDQATVAAGRGDPAPIGGHRHGPDQPESTRGNRPGRRGPAPARQEERSEEKRREEPHSCPGQGPEPDRLADLGREPTSVLRHNAPSARECLDIGIPPERRGSFAG